MYLLFRLTDGRSHILRCGAAVYSLKDPPPSSEKSKATVCDPLTQWLRRRQGTLPGRHFSLVSPAAALFHAQSDDGVYARRAACGHVARHQGGGTEHRRHTDKCGRIRWSDFEQEAFEKPRGIVRQQGRPERNVVLVVCPADAGATGLADRIPSPYFSRSTGAGLLNYRLLRRT